MSSIYTGTMGMVTNTTHLKLIADNIANSKTSGFKGGQSTFKIYQEGQFNKVNGESKAPLGVLYDQTHIDDNQIDFTQGSAYETKNELDFFIDDGDGGEKTFFKVRKGEEVLLTRNGHFSVDGDGYLSTDNGAFVLDRNDQPIKLPDDQSLKVSADGTFRNAEDNSIFNQIGLLSVDDNNLGFLEKVDGTQFRILTKADIERSFGRSDLVLDEYDKNITLQKIFPDRATLESVLNQDSSIVLEPSGSLQNFMLEASNVDVGREMTRMLEAQRGVEMSQKIITTYDKMLQRAANELGKV